MATLSENVSPIAYKLAEAAAVLKIDLDTLAGLRDDGLVITYRIGSAEYVTDFALRDLQRRLEVGAFTAPEMLQ